MIGITDLAIRRPVATKMVYLILIAFGIVSFRSLPVDLLPSIEFTELTVRTRYANVAPLEIEQIITEPVENAVSGLPNLERVSSRSAEGVSRVRLEFARGTNIDEAANDLRAALDRLRDQLPLEAETPEIWKFDLDRISVVALAATSTLPLDELTRVIEDDLAQRFEQIPGVGTINTYGGVYREIRVDLDRDRLNAAELTALDVRNALARENVTLAGGNVKSGYSDIFVRPMGEFQSLEEIEQVVVREREGYPVRVRDVADVVDSFEDVRYLAEVNGVPSVSISIQKQSGANTVDVVEEILDEVRLINLERDDIALTVITDQAAFIKQSIASVRNAAMWGALFAILVLYVFIRSRSGTAIIATAIPISVIATFGLLYLGGSTLNQMTFGGLALGVGMIVDSSIVVLESIVRKREEGGLQPMEAASRGARDVAGAVVASTLTTCVIFLPVIFTRSTSGALFQALAVVVVFALLCSLLVALTLVPMLAARSRELVPRSESARAHRRGLFSGIEARYSAFLRGAIRRRALTFGAAGLALCAALVAFRAIPFELAPPTDADEIDIEIEMAEGTNIAVVRSYLDELEARIRAVLPPDDVRFVSTEVRGGSAEVELKMQPQHERSMSSYEIADRLRDAVEGQIPGAEISVDAQSGLWMLRRIFSSSGGESDLQLELRGWDLAEADRVAADVKAALTKVSGVADVRVSRREGRPEERLYFDRARIAELGLSVEEVARTVRANVGGVEASRLRDSGREYPIVVRLKPEDRLTGTDLRQVTLRTPAGDTLPLSALVTRSRARSPNEIDRVDGQRVTYITATLESGVALGDAVAAAREQLGEVDVPPRMSLHFGGEYREQREARRDFVIAIVMALALVYMLLAAQFERYFDPLIVMLAVPMALVGVVPMLLLTGTTMNLQSVMGLVMLVGIVVNSSIVFVDAINLLRREQGLAPFEAAVEAGRLRLRPIMMTTLTTVLGLSPLALGVGAGAELQAALARTVIGGLLASTLVTLVLIPVAYVSASRLLERLTQPERGGLAEGSPASAG